MTAIGPLALTQPLRADPQTFAPLVDTLTLSDEFLVASYDEVGELRGRTPRVAFNGADYLVVWVNYTASHPLQGQIISAEGHVPSERRFRLPGNPSEFKIASNGQDFLVVWNEYNPPNESIDYRLLAARITPSATSLDLEPIEIASGEYPTSSIGEKFDVRSNGSDYLVAWQQINLSVNPTATTCFAVVVQSDGRLGSVGKKQIAYQAANSISIASIGSDYFVNLDDAKIVKIDSRGNLSDPNYFGPNYGEISFGQLAANDDSLLFTWTKIDRQSATDWDVYGVIIRGKNDVSAPFLLSGASGRQKYTTTSSSGQDYFAIWHDARGSGSSGPYDIMGARVSADGMVLDSDGLMIVESADAVASADRAIASSPFGYLISYRDPVTLDVKARLILDSSRVIKLESPASAIDGGAFTFETSAAPDQEYEIQYSNDLKTWQPLPSGPASPGSSLIEDTSVSDDTQRFYRAAHVKR